MTSKQCSFFCQIFTLLLGALLMAAGVYLYINWIEMFTRLRGKEMALSPTSPSFPSWKVSPLPLNFDVYLFNWTNPEDFYVGSNKKPHFEQIGPYRFRENPDKVDIVWHAHNHSISFRKKASFYFDAAGSKGTLQDKITTVNTVTHAAALRVKDGSFFAKRALEGALRVYDENIAITKTADEWIFTGYLDPIVTVGGFLAKFSSEIEVPYDRIGWLYTRNNSASFDGSFNMHTGADDIYKMGQIHTWNNRTHSDKFPGECGEVKGSMGEFFPPNLKTNDSISIYLPNLCRAVPLDYAETVTVHGVTAYKFSGGPRSIDNGTLYPETKCFCVNGKCEAAGVINVSPCAYNSPVYMSYPHFYKADPSYREAVEGLSPDPEKHDFFMTLEPNAGVVMDVGGGFQANYLLEPFDVYPYQNIKRTFIPIMWCEERVRVTPEIASDIALVPLIVLLGQIFTGALLAGGLILICWYPAKFATQVFKDPKKKTTLLNPLAAIEMPAITLPTVKKPHLVSIVSTPTNAAENNDCNDCLLVPLLEYRNGSFVYANSGDNVVADGVLSKTLRSPADVIIR